MIKHFLKLVDRLILGRSISKTKNFLQKKIQLKKLKKEVFNSQIVYSHKNNLFSSLCDKFGTDKGFIDLKKRIFYNNYHPHNYADIYSLLFDHCRHDFKNILELGIGTNNPNLASSMGKKYKPGSSLRALKAYFTKANVFGADIDDSILFEEERISTFYVDQLNPASISKMWNEVGNIQMDLIIDDGIHTLEGCKMFFDNSIENLREGGVYIIEDVDPIFLIELYNYFKKKKYNVSIIKLNSSKHNLLDDNNLIKKNKNLNELSK